MSASTAETSKVLETFEVFGEQLGSQTTETSKVLETFEVFGEQLGLATGHWSLVTAHCSLLTAHCSLLTDQGGGMMPIIDNPQNFKLPANAIAILQEMFEGTQRVVLKHDFSALGLSGGWVYRVHLLRGGGAPDLPVVVKIASKSLITKEWLAYQKCVENKWPGVAELRGEPIFSADEELAACSYPLMGKGVFEVKSLREYCLEADVHDIGFVLAKRLLPIMQDRIVLPSIPKFECPLRASYDSVLPVNLLIEVGAVPAGELPTEITPEKQPAVELDDAVRVSGFIVTKVDLRCKTVTLNLPQQSDKSDAYRLRLRFADAPPAYEIHKPIPPLCGVVVESRQSRFAQEVKKVMGAAFDPTAERVTLPNGTELPNPLGCMEAILRETRNLKFYCIHGDLNLENVLVDPDVRDVRLIDFAEAREDHVLHDFLRLETEVVTKLIPAALAEANLPPELIHSFYQQLHCATFQFTSRETYQLYDKALEKPFAILTEIRQAARKGFYNQDDFKEYYQCLTLYLVGVLRFKNLDSTSKQVAFWGAATAQELIDSPPCVESKMAWWRRKVGPVLLLCGAILLLAFLTFRLLSPQVARWYNNQGIEDYLAGDLPSAQANYEWAIYLNADYAEAHYNLGSLYEEAVKLEQARAEYRLAIDHGLDAAYNNLARLHILAGEYEEAIQLLWQGLKLVKNDDIKYDMLKNQGWARLGQKRYAEAETQLRQAIELNPKEAPAHCLLAEVREGQGADALQSWKTCLKYANGEEPDQDVWIDKARQYILGEEQ